MTLQEIVTQALRRLKRATDGQALVKYTPEVLFNVNEGIILIAQRYHQALKETVALTDGTFAKSLLSHRVFEITDVQASGSSVGFSETFAGSGVFEVDTTATSVDVIYRFVPDELSNATDAPEIPEEYHGMLVNYVVGNEQVGSDPSLQAIAAANFNMFNAKLNAIIPCDIPTVLTGYYT